MSARPGEFHLLFGDDPTRPRDLEITYTPEFSALVHELRGHIAQARKVA
jgi:NitT/TauT family transport system ATP-binding protein